jgi:hypothetical protein
MNDPAAVTAVGRVTAVFDATTDTDMRCSHCSSVITDDDAHCPTCDSPIDWGASFVALREWQKHTS